MKTIFFIFCLFSIACVSTGLKARSVASTECNVNDYDDVGWLPINNRCNINTYQDFVFQDNADPTLCNLREADLRHADLRGADLRGADLRRADLRRADLQEADFGGAKMYCTDLRWANLSWAKLKGADLRGAKVTCSQARFLQANHITEFDSPGWLECFFDYLKNEI